MKCEATPLKSLWDGDFGCLPHTQSEISGLGLGRAETRVPETFARLRRSRFGEDSSIDAVADQPL
jgi:hypothetical protein